MLETYANIPLFMAQIKIILPLLILFIVVVIAILSFMHLHVEKKMNNNSNTNVSFDVSFCDCTIMNKDLDEDIYYYEYLTAYQHKEDGHIIFVPDSLSIDWHNLTKDEDCWKRIDSCFI